MMEFPYGPAYKIRELWDLTMPMQLNRLLTRPTSNAAYVGQEQDWDRAHGHRLLYELDNALYQQLAAWIPDFQLYTIRPEIFTQEQYTRMCGGESPQHDYLKFYSERRITYRLRSHTCVQVMMRRSSSHSHEHGLGVIRNVFLVQDRLYVLQATHPGPRRGRIRFISAASESSVDLYELVARRRKLQLLTLPSHVETHL